MGTAIRQQAQAEGPTREALAREITESAAALAAGLPAVTALRDKTAAKLDAALAALEPLEEAALEADRAWRAMTEGHAILVARNEAELRATADDRIRLTGLDVLSARENVRLGRRYSFKWTPGQLSDDSAEGVRLTDLYRTVDELALYTGGDLLDRLNAIRESAGLPPYSDPITE